MSDMRAYDTQPILKSVETHADLIIEHARDQWGDLHGDLFVDGIHVETYEPVVWKYKKKERLISNFASQQVWLRTLSSLSEVTAKPRYKEQALDTLSSALETLVAPNGLVYWGGHVVHDVGRDEPWGMWEYGHELKDHFPWYAGLAQIDAQATKRIMETVWTKHMVDWDLLLFDRHAKIPHPHEKVSFQAINPNWNYPYRADIELPIKTETSSLSFNNATTTLIYTAFQHHLLTGDPHSLRWSLRLADRYWSLQDPNTGLGGVHLQYQKSARFWR